MPTSSIDTFFACTVILAASLIATVFLASTLQLQIADSQDINKQSYLNALADHVINSPGAPSSWGTTNASLSDFGLALSGSQSFSELDVDKINRLYNSSLYSPEFVTSINLYNTALGLKISQLLDVEIRQSSNSTINNLTTFTFEVSTSINSKPTSAALKAYTKATNFLSNVTASTSTIGVGSLLIEIPETLVNSSKLIVFARSSVDSRITSLAVYDFNNSTQESVSEDVFLTVYGPINSTLTWVSNDSLLAIEKVDVFSFGYAQNVSVANGTAYCLLPNLVDLSPQIIVLSGNVNGSIFQTWVTNPRLPFEVGSDFNQSEQNVFSYLKTIKGTLYKVEVTLGDLPR
jgi:hypothetical protein